jgi:murein L,D-transpeptidase YafK
MSSNPSRPRLVIIKHTSTLAVYQGDQVIQTIPVVTGKNPADKTREGDLATPEGEFYVCYLNPESKYHRFLGLSYPNTEDAARGLRDGLITAAEHDAICDAVAKGECPPWKTALGGEVGIHGPCPNRTWTHGCIAMNVDQIEQLYGLLRIGDQVTILP